MITITKRNGLTTVIRSIQIVDKFGKPKTTGISAGEWGSITGTLSNQTDLQAELDALQSAIDALDAGYRKQMLLGGM